MPPQIMASSAPTVPALSIQPPVRVIQPKPIMAPKPMNSASREPSALTKAPSCSGASSRSFVIDVLLDSGDHELEHILCSADCESWGSSMDRASGRSLGSNHD